MHIGLQLAPVLAAEKSKVPFYIAGGVLIAWALIVSMAIGMRKSDFPRDKAQQRVVMGVSGLLVAVAIAMAVVTSGAPEKATAAGVNTTGESAPATTQPAATTPASTQPTATTGTPAPPSSPAAAGTKLAISADPSGQLAYSTKTLSATAGKVTITMTNSSPLEHNITVIEKNQRELGATPTFVGGSKTLTLNLKAGKYTFFCSVPGHRAAGMEGTLTVSS